MEVELDNGLVVAMPPKTNDGVSVGTTPSLYTRIPASIVSSQTVIKRGLDIAMSMTLLAFSAPLLLIISFVIRIESPGPVIFRQLRFGEQGRPILVMKFRTMRAGRRDSAGEYGTAPRDPRVTLFGRLLRRTSLDELPQLLNVLRGEMSLVGPRAHPVHMRIQGLYYFDVFKDYHKRHSVKPGITGWAQVNGSRGTIRTMLEANNRLTLDLFYVRNWSLRLDIYIMLRTILGGFIVYSD